MENLRVPRQAKEAARRVALASYIISPIVAGAFWVSHLQEESKVNGQVEDIRSELNSIRQPDPNFPLEVTQDDRNRANKLVENLNKKNDIKDDLRGTGSPEYAMLRLLNILLIAIPAWQIGVFTAGKLADRLRGRKNTATSTGH